MIDLESDTLHTECASLLESLAAAYVLQGHPQKGTTQSLCAWAVTMKRSVSGQPSQSTQTL